MLAAVLWGITLPALIDPALTLRFGADFVHFYTLGWLAVHRAGEVLYNPAALQATQAALVPALADRLYLPLYPPQAAVVFAPFAMLSYSLASAFWSATSVVGYLLVICLAIRDVPRVASERVLLWTAAIAFPPFWYLVMFRQNSVIVLIVLFGGWQFLERRRAVLAGFVLGFLALKPQFGIPFAVVALYRRDRPLIAGALCSAALQVVIAMIVFGPNVIADYVSYLPRVAATANVTEPVLYKSLSLRTLSRMLPSPIGEAVWAVVCIFVLLAVMRVSRARVPVRLFMALAILAAVLVSPHVYVYDGVVLVLPFLWLGEWRLERREGGLFLCHALLFWSAAFLMMPATLAFGPVAAVIMTVAAIPALVMLFWTSIRDVEIQYADSVFSTVVCTSS